MKVSGQIASYPYMRKVRFVLGGNYENKGKCGIKPKSRRTSNGICRISGLNN